MKFREAIAATSSAQKLREFIGSKLFLCNSVIAIIFRDLTLHGRRVVVGKLATALSSRLFLDFVFVLWIKLMAFRLLINN